MDKNQIISVVEQLKKDEKSLFLKFGYPNGSNDSQNNSIVLFADDYWIKNGSLEISPLDGEDFPDGSNPPLQIQSEIIMELREADDEDFSAYCSVGNESIGNFLELLDEVNGYREPIIPM